jgi:hypothetical protein
MELPFYMEAIQGLYCKRYKNGHIERATPDEVRLWELVKLYENKLQLIQELLEPLK